MALNRQGVAPDQEKIEALLKLPEPKTEVLLQSFLGIKEVKQIHLDRHAQ